MEQETGNSLPRYRVTSDKVRAIIPLDVRSTVLHIVRIGD